MTPDDPINDPLDAPLADRELAARLAAAPPIDDRTRRRSIDGALAVYDEMYPATDRYGAVVGARRWLSAAAAVLVVVAGGVVVATQIGGDDQPSVADEAMVMSLDDQPVAAAGADLALEESTDTAEPVDDTGLPATEAPVETATADQPETTIEVTTTEPSSAAPAPVDSGDRPSIASPGELAEYALGRSAGRITGPVCLPPGAAVLGEVRYRQRDAFVIELDGSIRAIAADDCTVLATAP